MKAEGMKNHGVRIMYALQNLIACTLHTGMCYGKSAIRFETSSHHEFSVPLARFLLPPDLL
jgi:hypothetical protein